MGGSSKGGQTTTQSTTTKPWNIEQLRGVGRGAERLVKRDVGYKPFEDPTYIPFSSQTQQGLNQTEAIARSPQPLIGGSQNYLGSILGQNGMSSQMTQAMQPLERVSSGQNAIDGGMYGSVYGKAQGPTASAGLSDVAGGQRGINTGMFGNAYSQSQAPTASSSLGGIAAGAQNVGTGNFQDIYASSGGPTASNQYLRDTAAGANLSGNPYLMASLNRGADEIALRSNMSAAGAGRYGSGAAAKTTADSLSNYYNTALMQNYDTERSRQMQAAGQIDTTNQAQLQGRLGAAQGLANIQNQNIGNQMGAAGQMDQARNAQIQNQINAAQGYAGAEGQNISNMIGASGQMDQARMAQLQSQLNAAQGYTGVQGQNIGNQMNAANMQAGLYGQGLDRGMQGLGMAGAINDLQYAPSRALMGVGQAYEGKAGEVLGDSIQRWNAYQARPWEQIGRLNSILTGAGALGGTAVTQQPAASPLAGILGGGMAGASILGSLGGMGATGGLGALLPIGGAALGGLWR
jgi:hypothetical protein